MNSLHLLQRHGWKREEGRRRCKIVARSRSITFVCGSTRVHTRSIRAGSIDRSPHYRAHCPVQHCLRRQRGGNEGGEGRRRARCISLSSLFHNEAAVSAWVCGRLSSTRKKERERERERGRRKEKKSGEGEGGGGSFRGHEVTCALSSRPRASCRVFNAGYRRYVRIFCLLRFTSPFTSAPGSSWRTNVGRDKFIAEYCTRALCDTTVWKVARSPISIVFVFPPRFHPLTKKTKLCSSRVKTSCKEKEKRRIRETWFIRENWLTSRLMI